MTDTPYVFGLTFVGRHSFAPFVETIEQVNRDIDAGFPYLVGDVSENTADVSAQFPLVLQGVVFGSHHDVNSWATPIARAERAEDWWVGFDADYWRRVVTIECMSEIPDFATYQVRRARRLNALIPPSAFGR